MATINKRPRGRPRNPEPKEESMDEFMQRRAGVEPKGSKADQATTIAELQAQLGAMNKRMEQQDRENMALLAPAVSVVVPPKEPQLNMDGLPDPIVNPKEYGQELAKRQTAYFTEMQNYNAAKNAPPPGAGDVNVLWEDFKSQHGEYLENEDGLEFAITKVLKKAKAKGIDIDKYRFQFSDRFFKDITETYDGLFGKPGEQEDVDDVEDRRTPARKAQPEPDEDSDEGRTSGIFGGIDSSGTGKRGSPEVNPYAPSGMVKDIQDMQRKSGYF